MFLNVMAPVQWHNSEMVSMGKYNLKLFMLQLLLLNCQSNAKGTCECEWAVPSSFRPAKSEMFETVSPSQRQLTRRATCRLVTVVPVRTAPGRGAVTAVSCWVCCCCCTWTCAVCCCAPCWVCCAACCWGSCSFCFCNLISCSCKIQTPPSFPMVYITGEKWRWIQSLKGETFCTRLELRSSI